MLIMYRLWIHTITCYSYQANLLEIIRTLDNPHFSQFLVNLGTIYVKDTFCNKLPSIF